MQVNIKVNCDNAAMADGEETLSDLLRKLAEKLERLGGIETLDHSRWVTSTATRFYG